MSFWKIKLLPVRHFGIVWMIKQDPVLFCFFVQSPKKNFERPSKSRELFLKTKWKSLPPWKQHIKIGGSDQNFCTILFLKKPCQSSFTKNLQNKTMNSEDGVNIMTWHTFFKNITTWQNAQKIKLFFKFVMTLFLRKLMYDLLIFFSKEIWICHLRDSLALPFHKLCRRQGRRHSRYYHQWVISLSETVKHKKTVKEY